MSSGVLVSGSYSDYVAPKAPSGQWSVNLDAFLVSLNASFGFNETAHRFSLQFVPKDYNGGSGNLPAIGTYTTYEIRPPGCEPGFFLAGNVVHADYGNAIGGTNVSIEVEDRRKDILNEVTISTEDLGTDIPSGIVSVAAMYRDTIGFVDASGNISDDRVKEYRNILELGATYEQIYQALVWASGQSQITLSSDKVPTPLSIATNLLGSTAPLRFKFTATPLSEVISAVCSDASFDWYWGMRDDKVKLVNRKVEFVVTEDSLPIQVLSPDSTDFKFGSDIVSAPSKVTVLGANQEGFLNSRLLSPIDGLDEPAGVDYTFVPAWTNISVSFYDRYGVYRSYKPTERELQYALLSMDHWAYYKKYQVSIYGDVVDDGYTAAQDTTFQSRLDPMMPVAEFYNNSVSGVRIIKNRYNQDHIWTMEWFSRVANHANTHYGKTYALSGIVFNEAEGALQVIESAWCNLENQIDGTYFTENYSIKPLYAPVSPFVTQDFKVQAHAVMPSSTLYGPEGLDAPAAFTDWNEDAHPSGDQTYEHYIPVELFKVGQRVIDPRATENAFEDYPEGTIIAQFPVLVASGKNPDVYLGTVVTLHELGARLAASGTEDTPDPTQLVHAWKSISGVAIPVQSRKRYGQSYPALWTSGTGSGTRAVVIVDDQFAPWNYFPLNTTNSVDIMSQRVSGYIQANLVDVQESRFAELTKIDWPFIGFDEFARQDYVSGVFGRRDHGVTDIGVSFSQGVPRTTYGIKSFFTDFVKEAPLSDKNYADLNNIIHPIEFMDLANGPRRPLPDLKKLGKGPNFPSLVPPGGIRKEVYAVTITQVFNRGDVSSAEYYYSITKDNIPKPGGSVDVFDTDDLVCRDGFLNVGDKCLYHVEYNAQNARRRYYTGGTDLTAGAAVVEISAIDVPGNQVDITYRGFTIPAVTVIPGADISTLSTGDFGSLQTDGTMHPDNNANITGLRPEVDAPTGTYFVPVGGAGTSPATPVIIVAISNFGGSGATATVQEIIPSGASPDFVGSGTQTTGVRPIPIAQFAQSGDVGVLTQNSAGDQFIFINRQAFAIYGG